MYINNIEFPRKGGVKYMGKVINSRLTWKQHSHKKETFNRQTTKLDNM